MVHRNILLSDYLFPNSTSTPRERESSQGYSYFSNFWQGMSFLSQINSNLLKRGWGQGVSNRHPLSKHSFLKIWDPHSLSRECFYFFDRVNGKGFFSWNWRLIALPWTELNWTEVTDWSSCRNFVKKITFAQRNFLPFNFVLGTTRNFWWDRDMNLRLHHRKSIEFTAPPPYNSNTESLNSQWMTEESMW